MSVYRSRNVFEPILALFHSPTATESAQEHILQLVHRAIRVGGSTVLITNCGILAFLELAQTSSKVDSTALKILTTELLEHADHARVDQWNGGN